MVAQLIALYHASSENLVILLASIIGELVLVLVDAAALFGYAYKKPRVLMVCYLLNVLSGITLAAFAIFYIVMSCLKVRATFDRELLGTLVNCVLMLLLSMICYGCMHAKLHR